MRINELVFDKLHDHIDRNRQNDLFWADKKDQESADNAGNKCTDIRDKGTESRENGDDLCIGQTKKRKSDEDQNTQMSKITGGMGGLGGFPF